MHTLRNLLVGAGAAVALAGVATIAAAQTPNPSASVAANATIIRPLTVAPGSPMGFGTVAPGGTNGTITVSTAGARTGGGGLSLVNGQTGVTAATFNIGGENATPFNITLASSITSAPGATGSPNTTTGYSLGDLTAAGCGAPTSAATTPVSSITGASTSNNNTCVLTLGGTMGIPANALNGAVVGSITATLNYQ
jgi:hypothetical protein